METLNRATEILSKYAFQGNLTREDFEHFEKMVIAIIDGIEDELTDGPNISNVKENRNKAFESSKYRLKDSLIKQDTNKEKTYGLDDVNIYAYYSGDSSLYIVGEIFSKKPKKSFCMICTIYDKDGDIIETSENRSYGSGLVTSMIEPEVFFNRFPFKFSFWGIQKKDIKEIKIIPADSY
jgi:hypothetical protein